MKFLCCKCNFFIDYRTKWLVEGVLQLNPKLNGHPRIETVSLSAITRVDLSHNQLSNLPIELLNLVSLR